MKRILMLLLLLMLPAVAGQTFDLQPEQPQLGELLTIQVEEVENAELYVDTPTTSYRFIGDFAAGIDFIPNELGPHSIRVTRGNENVSVIGFEVGADIQRDSPILYPLKPEYGIDDAVVLRLNTTPGDHVLRIASNSTEYEFLGELDYTMFFYPFELGEHTAKLYNDDILIASSAFTVVESIEKELEPHTWHISVRTADDVADAKIRIFDENNGLIKEIRKRDLNKTHSANIESQEDFEVEIVPENSPVERVLLRDVVVDQPVIDFGLENVSTERLEQTRDWKLAFALDATQTEFSSGDVTLTAVGNELYRCLLWDFASQQCLGAWEKLMDIVPGEPYVITFTPGEQGYAETGVASINTKKPAYLRGETVELIAVVLDTQGFYVPEADVTIEITDPRDRISTFTTETGTITETAKGIYEASYINTQFTGRYAMRVEALGVNVNHTLISHFVVEDFIPYDIIRDTPVGIDPFTAPFVSRITVTSHTDARQFNVTEVLPGDFTVHDSAGAFVRRQDDSITLTWFNVSSGSTVGYVANSPPITPELYELGRILVQIGTEIYEEARGWFVAVDPPTPHNVAGRIFHNGTDSNGVANYYPVRINNTVTGDLVQFYVFAPPIPIFAGSYSGVIDGDDGNVIKVYSWNATHVGNVSVPLASGTTTADVVLNYSRTPEPNITIVRPVDDEVIGTGDPFRIEVNVTMLGVNAIDCTVLVELSNETAVNFSLGEEPIHIIDNMSWPEWNVTSWRAQATNFTTFNITATASCSNTEEVFDHGLSFVVTNLTVIDTTPPFTQVANDTNTTWVNFVNQTFTFNTTDANPTANCSLVWDDVVNLTTLNPEQDTNTDFFLNNTVEGLHSWYVSCWQGDPVPVEGQSATLTLGVDLTPPNLTVFLPKNNTAFNQSMVDFVFNTTDIPSGVRNCTVTVDDEGIYTNTSISDPFNNYTVILEGGFHNFSIACFDYAGNFNMSETYFINVSAPDLTIVDDFVNITPRPPIEGQAVLINTTIINQGNRNATEFNVVFYLNDVANNDVIQNFSNLNLTPGESIQLNATWIATTGNNTITVSLDPPTSLNGSIFELNESNNVESVQFFTSPYQIFYGDVISNSLLTLNLNFSLFNRTGQAAAGHIFVVDTDSTVFFTNLTALGRGVNGTEHLDDFVELDSLLNLTGTQDSINESYTTNGAVNTLAHYNLLNEVEIFNVSVRNTTNNTPYVTGILWDSTDNNPGDYNTSQDVVFIGNVTPSRDGAFGIYDFEMAVPAALRDYVEGGSESSLSFYTELR